MSDRDYLESFMVLKDNEPQLWIAIPCIALEQNAFGQDTARGADLCEAPESGDWARSAIEHEQSMLTTAFVCALWSWASLVWMARNCPGGAVLYL